MACAVATNSASAATFDMKKAARYLYLATFVIADGDGLFNQKNYTPTALALGLLLSAPKVLFRPIAAI